MHEPSLPAVVPADGASASQRFPFFARAALILIAVVAVLVSLRAIAPLTSALGLLGVLVWFAFPGIVVARRLYGSWAVALLAGPAWGYVLSSLALLGLWAAGVRGFSTLMLAPIPAAVAAWPARALARTLSVPSFSRQDIGALALVVLTVPAIVGLPYSRVGANLPEGRAYRAYFTADFIWAMAVVSEVSKGDMPPRNPYYLGDDLHYYWLVHLLPAAEHRAAGRALTVEQVLLVNALWSGLTFVGFLYLFVRHFVERPWAAASACVGVMFCSSFEGTQQIWGLWQRGRSLEALRYLNIDAISRWVYQSMPVDGLHRLILYQPQHQLGYLLGFSALLLLIQARDCSRAALLFVAGLFLGMSMLLSSFAAGMLAIVTAAYEAWRLVRARQWKAFIPCAVAAAVPMIAALVLISVLHYVDTGSPLVRLGVNRVATRSWKMAIFLSFGPVLIVALGGVAAVLWRRALGRFIALGIVLATCTVFYFLVDVPDHQSVYVGWHAGKLAFIAFAPLCGFALQEWWACGRWTRLIMGLVTVIVALAAIPTVLIDLYNTQDVWNRAQGPGFRWTVMLSPEEVKGLDWIKDWTPKRARVQVEPNVRGRDTWAYLSAFAERRMSAGLPISMIPLAKYEKASEQIRSLYLSTSAKQAYDLSVSQCIDYLVIGPPERAAYPHLQPLLDTNTHLFTPAFRNDALAVYAVPRDRDRSSCPR